jgi:hypothetical protein
MTQEPKRRKKAAGIWRRRYVVAILVLLVLGTLSTFALTYVQTSLEEPWGAQYTLTYTGASIVIGNPKTTIVDQNTLYVEFDITPSDKDVKCKFVITPLDINGDPIDAGGTLSPDTKQVDAGMDLTTTHNMGSPSKLNKMRIRWTSTNFLSLYESVRILIEDIE